MFTSAVLPKRHGKTPGAQPPIRRDTEPVLAGELSTYRSDVPTPMTFMTINCR